MHGTVFDVQRFSVHDGPGIRTTVFLKGCPLRCAWCQNPEGLERGLRLWNFDNLCAGCGACVAVCPAEALAMGVDGKPAIDRQRCTLCGACVERCNHNAMAVDGFEIGADALAERLLADRVFFESSGGGVTFSGGEPLAQAAFVGEVAGRLHAMGIHTAVETSLQGQWDDLAGWLPGVDYFQVDIKLLDSQRHLAATGVGNGTILENFRRLADALRGSGRLKVRIPLIPGFTADAENIAAIGGFVAGVDATLPVELMNYNPLAAAKYRRRDDVVFALAGETKAFGREDMERFQNSLAVSMTKNARNWGT